MGWLVGVLFLVAGLATVVWPAADAYAAGYLTHRDAVARLAVAGISVFSTGNCTDRNNPNCTSLEHIRQSTIDGVITLRRASRCAITVTGGTEAGHGPPTPGLYSHWNGWKVDIARLACIGTYIRTGFAFTGHIAGWGDQYRAPSGNVYTDEGDHWDITYYTCGGCDPAPSPTRSPSPREPVSPSPSPSLAPSAGPSVPAGPHSEGPEQIPVGPPIADIAHLADHPG